MDLRQTLLESPFTVTHLLGELTGEELVADVVRRASSHASTDNDLGVQGGRDVMHRNAILRGKLSGRPYLYAESVIVVDRLPPPVRTELEETNHPIGPVLVAHGLSVERRALPHPDPFEPDSSDSLSEIASDIGWSRAYLLLIDRRPVFAIREWFMRWVTDALDRRAPD